ncbi:MAG TPA: CoA pyrophosphatase [Nitrososphaeraceae archaeon]|nr:CoA pyrophosphatase [Nitrososphaeraceae archaeon]
MYDQKLVKDLIYPFLRKELILPSQQRQFKFASVMITIHFTKGDPYVLLIRRTKLVKNHAGEISFPGGNFTKEDVNMLQTAIRETEEELGMSIKREQVIGSLNAEKTLTSKYIIYPYVALLDNIPGITITNYEVEKIIDAPLISLLKSRENDVNHQQEYSISHLPKFTYKNEVIWGATARILDQLVKIFSHKRDF